jgi:hypothetical protein
MRKITRLGMLGLSVVAASALVASPAGAAPAAGTSADQFGARANAESLTISIAGTQLTGSKATADLNNDPTSAAEASMILTPAFAPEPLKAAASAANPSDIKAPETCTGNELEAVPGIGRLDITCPSVMAKVDGALPYAKALGAQLVLEPSVSNVLDTLGLQDTVTGASDQVFEQVIDPLVQALTGTPLEEIADDTVQTVQDVLNDTLTLNSTARIVVAPALAEVSSTADTITSTAHSQGIRIELLPVNELGATNGLLPDDLVPGKPLVTITIGDARAVSTYNRITGVKGKPMASASAVTIELGSVALAERLGLANTKIEVAPGVEQCVLTGTPLETCVSVATAGTDADGNPYATSTSVALFKGLNGGIDLSTGGVTSGAAGALPAALPAAAPDLPRTGANPSVAIIGAGFLAVAVLIRRGLIGRA